uniref:60S ribosomal protein L34 n=1 Tax=Odontella aurita TaxID=265563 RepID=A0A6U6EHT2_9STRA|mmetsp:Transcript_26816/g.79249  ORF Transcript_26816/g.79249 Transcript_26816/m.79249 type:complete len:115 (+) Transcript_26816:206-550(+)|eukprot:CAMPEP_0113550812 /NCGR_PEP_ID=MMETSP0015_2-20120614/14185_1 /TAXON_ID=2838 /ORGANISM="Odontella" /LENGTH=114 /DNA_ID=CAMNT_0000451651 /DNA_START=480 /DNA_END=824 /DNA_ORIENTATION=+ /assembly_acc=CAM_ASM_000160
MGDNRVTRKGRHPYNTASNRAKPVRTPGGKLVARIVVKKTKGPRCSDCHTSLPGIKHLKNSAYRNLKKRERTVSRAYGGSCCGGCLRMRIVRAFLLEEQKAVKKLMSERAAAAK